MAKKKRTVIGRFDPYGLTHHAAAVDARGPAAGRCPVRGRHRRTPADGGVAAPSRRDGDGWRQGPARGAALPWADPNRSSSAWPSSSACIPKLCATGSARTSPITVNASTSRPPPRQTTCASCARRTPSCAEPTRPSRPPPLASPRDSTRPGDGQNARDRAARPLRGEPVLCVLQDCAVDLLRLSGPRGRPGRTGTRRPRAADQDRRHPVRSGHTYGSPRVYATVARRSIRLGRKRVDGRGGNAGAAAALARQCEMVS